MFPVILIVLFSALTLAGTAICIRACRQEDAAIGVPSGTAAFVGAGLLIAVLIVWPTVYYASVGNITEMEAFYHNTLESYQYTVRATGEIEITNAQAGLVDIAYQEQGVTTSERLRELWDRVEWFNARLRHYQRFNDMAIAAPFLADVPDDLAPIILSERH